MLSDLPTVLRVAVVFAVGAILLASVITLWWVARTPRAIDRVVGIELLAGLTTALFVVLAVWQQSLFFVEVALLLALVGFIGTIAFARLGGSSGGDA